MGLFGKSRNTQAFEELVRPHVDRLYRLAYRLAGSRVDAEDLVQDLVVKLHSQWDTLERMERPAAWMAKVLFRMFIDDARRKGRSPLEAVDDLAEFEADPRQSQEINSTLFRLENDQYVRQLARALEKLNECHRLVVMLHDVEGYSLAEIEEITGLAAGTIKSRLHRARARLRETLGDGTFSAPGACKRMRGDENELRANKALDK